MQKSHVINNIGYTQRLFTLAAIGCSGPIGKIYVEKFIQMGIKVKLLARDQKKAIVRNPGAQVIKGTMMNVADCASAMTNVDAAFLITPIGARNDKSIEIDAAKVSIEAAQQVNLPHLIFVSVIGIDQPNSVPILETKLEIEKMFAESGVPWTSIRCGSYMEDVIDRRIDLIKKIGIFPFPVKREHLFNFTSQKDIPRLVKELFVRGVKLNRSLDFIDPKTYTPREVAGLLTKITGRRVVASGKWPIYYILLLAWPFFFCLRHRLSTIIPLIRYFNRNGYTGNGKEMGEVFHDFRMTTLKEHLNLLQKIESSA